MRFAREVCLIVHICRMHTGNATSHTSLSVIIKVCVVIPFFCVFLCCIVIMLRIFATNRHFLDNSRYILFAYMLINDTLQLLVSVILFLLVMCLVTFPTVYCVPLLLLSTSTFMNTTLILATMSLERYVAIIYPLQCPAAWRSDRIWIIILSIWFLSFIFPMIEFSIGERDPAVDILSTPVLCIAFVINSSPIQALFQGAVNILFFAVVSVVILFTYIQILLKTRKMRQNKVCVVIPFFYVFLCCIVIVLRIFATNRHFLDNSRYILFAYMLINDTLQLLSSVILFLLVIGLVTFPTVYCVPLLLLSASTFMNTTLILATMSLERYVAIIYPLQCPAAWRSDPLFSL
ncbi:hypothetical protein F7725_020558 [Dissostichus mawsoni]|uniref:G-protein coupled receptors family 1 profile domain-containing protein n=1 Tax=Dissostichus mawsoni TaxID=36200 RepID=A0A7J5YDM3_DISMA|nr:hypothetical protein F7725_020558 [Dissostichus mawsoni]